MKPIKIVLLITLVLGINSCKDFEELQIDPNRSTLAHPSLLLTGIETTTFNVIKEDPMLASRMMVWTDGAANAQYYGWQRNNFDSYSSLRQIGKMEEEADRVEAPNYKALALFLRAHTILEITKLYGDVPFSDAIQASNDVYEPVYDTQESIYIKVLEDLEQANANLDPAGVITGDVIYNGDVTKWKKLINSYELRVLMSLSNKTGNSALNVEQRFSDIVNNPDTRPIFTSNDDNAALNFADAVNNRYPFFNNNSFKTAYYMEESFVDLLKGFEDPRLFTFADITPIADEADLPENDFSAYGGLFGSALLATNTTRLVAGEASRLDTRYYQNAINEPSLLLSYAEVEFTLAEGIKRGWISGDAGEHYENGIRASMAFHGISGGDQDAYLDNPGVAYDDADGIEMIITQKYINFFMQGGWEAFFNQRRTGFPEFNVDGGGILNDGLIPKRWMYPQDELQLNSANVQAAIDRQFGEDNINEVMWLLQPE